MRADGAGQPQVLQAGNMQLPTAFSRDGTRLVYRDVRRFGTWLVLEGPELEPYLATKNGPEPLGPRFTARWLVEQLARRRAPLKAVLLDQRVVAGLGNIYADEALWRARVSPLRPANEVSYEEIGRLTGWSYTNTMGTSRVVTVQATR